MNGRGETDVMYHGPRLSAWVRGKGVIPATHLPDNLERACRRWAAGERATERLVDQLCCHMGWGSHISVVPHDFIVRGRHLIDPDYEEREAA